jgi:sugar transferase (PEP-CTERM/EpsH1 system associated)
VLPAAPQAQPAIRRAVLYVAHRVPFPPDKGDRIRAFHILQHLSGLAAVHLACLADEPVDPGAVRALECYCERVAIVRLGPGRWLRALGSLARGCTVTAGAFTAPALRTTLRAWARTTRFDACLASASGMAPYLRLPELRGVPAVVDLVDVDSQKWLDYAAAGRGPRAWLYRTEGRRLRRLEQGLASWARARTRGSDVEAGLYRGFCPGGPVHAVRNGVDLDYFRPRPGPVEPACLFLGALDYRPNVDAVRWFCDTVWPTVHGHRPEAKLYLVGRRPAPAVRRLAGRPGVKVVGPVPDVRPHVARAALTVAPLRIARGVQNKVLEALAMGKATVISPACRSGLRVEPDADVLVASAPAEWVEAVLRLLDDEGLRQRLGAAGRRHVEGQCRWERCLEPLAALLGLSLGPANGVRSEPRRGGIGQPGATPRGPGSGALDEP